MAVKNTNIVLIGPAGVGKSTQGKLLSEALNMQSVSLDSIANKYYEQNGFDYTRFHEIKRNSYLDAYRYWWPSLAYAATQVVKDYSNSVIDFGAGHSHYENKQIFNDIKKSMSNISNVILLLPSIDLDESVLLLKKKSLKERRKDWVHDGYDFIEHWVKDTCNHKLATDTFYTKGKSPEKTRDEILNAIRLSS